MILLERTLATITPLSMDMRRPQTWPISIFCPESVAVSDKGTATPISVPESWTLLLEEQTTSKSASSWLGDNYNVDSDPDYLQQSQKVSRTFI
jgi:hypothetical protein